MTESGALPESQLAGGAGASIDPAPHRRYHSPHSSPHPSPSGKVAPMLTWSSRARSLLLIGALAVAAVAAARPQPAPRQLAAPALSSEAAARLVERHAPLLADGDRSLQAARLAGRRAPTELVAVAILADFADTCFYGREDQFDGPLPTSTQSDFYYAAHDSLYYDHLLRDVADYYAAVSGGRFTLDYRVHGTVAGLAEGMAHYGDHPEEGEQSVLLAADAIAALDAEIDFSLYDTVLLIHAGAGEETDVLGNSPEQIYSTYLGPEDFQEAVEDSILAAPYIATDDHPEGEGVRHVLILPENQFQDAFEGFSGYYGSLGVYCFEVGLRLGMLSLTDFTPAGAPDSQGIGQFGLMGYGLFSAGGFVPPEPCAFNKQLMGWLDPYPADPDAAATWTLHPAADPSDPLACARVDLTGAEYFLLEYRLQDPDGNGIFSFTGDLNGNNTPDFFDADSQLGDGTPTGFFDPATDTREWFTGAEWDFFLSDNTARPQGPGVPKGRGSGIYIWHVDETVIRAAFGAERNLFNADPARKSVDVEEADGIQDLDSREPSPYWLGGDLDSFRGEDADRFGPDTRPDTRTNGGLRTGILVDAISDVVVDSTHVFNPGAEDEYTGIRYADSMTFQLSRQSAAADAPQRLASRDLPGADLAGSDLLAVRLDPEQDVPVLAAVSRSGEIFALRADLTEWVDHDGDPATVAPLAAARDAAGEAVAANLPLAAGQLESGGTLELVLTADDGVYAFGADGEPLGDVGGATGRIARLDSCRLPAVLLPPEGTAEDGDVAGTPVLIAVVERQPDGDRLRLLDHQGQDVIAPLTLYGRATAAPVRLRRSATEDHLLVPVDASPDGGGQLRVVTRAGTGWSVSGSRELAAIPGQQRPMISQIPGGALVAALSDTAGRGQFCQTHGPSGSAPAPWPDALALGSPLGPRGALLQADGALARVDVNGERLLGWPRRPRPATTASAAAPLVLTAALPGDAKAAPFVPDQWDDAFLFHTGDGRLFLLDEDGEVRPGWPLPGPAGPAGSPALVRRGDGRYLLFAAGAHRRVAGVDPDTDQLLESVTGTLQSWILDLEGGMDPDAMLADAMAGGGPWRAGWPVGTGSVRTDPVHEPRFAASVVCYPQPLTGRTLHVRGDAVGEYAGDGDVRIQILDLQGEVVRDVRAPLVAGRVAFDVPIDLAEVASGLYVCRVAVNDGTGAAVTVKTIAVAR